MGKKRKHPIQVQARPIPHRGMAESVWSFGLIAALSVVLVYSMVTSGIRDESPLRTAVLLFSAIALLSVLSVMIAPLKRAVGFDRSPAVREDPQSFYIYAAPALFTVMMLISILYAYTPAHAFREAIKYGAGFAVFSAVFILCRSSRANTRRLLWALLIVIALCAVLSIETASSRVLLSSIIDRIAAESTIAAEAFGYWNGMRMMTIINANVSAGLFIIGIHIACFLFFDTKSKKRFAAAGLCVLCSLGFVLCVSVGATLAGGVSILLAIFLSAKGDRRKIFIFFISVFAVSALLALAVSAALNAGLSKEGSAFFVERFHDIENNPYAAERLLFWGNAAEIISENNIFFGAGAGAFETKLMQVQTVFSESRYVHNHYLQILLETGVVGLLLYGAALFFVFRRLVRILRGKVSSSDAGKLAVTLIAVMVFVSLHAAIDFDFSFLPFFVIVCVLLGISAVGIAYGDEEPGENAGISASAKDVPARVRGRGAIIQKGFGIAIPSVVIIVVLCNAAAQSGMDRTLSEDPINGEKLLAQTSKSIALDRPHRESYMAMYLNVVTGQDLEGTFLERAEQYAGEIDKVSDRSIGLCQTLIAYYFPLGDFEKVLHYAKMIPNIRVMDPAACELAISVCEQVYEAGDESAKEAAQDAMDEIRAILAER